MASKIIVYDEETEEDAASANSDFQAQMLAYMQSMDWKLWEILKIQQKQELVSEAPMPPPTVKPDSIIVSEAPMPPPTVKPDSIIVDEDDT
jgi:hypothetical protein